MRSSAFLAIGLPLLVGAQDYPWLKDPNWKPANGWGTPASGWDSVDYSGGKNNNGQAPGQANNQQASAAPVQQSSSAAAYVPPPSSTANAAGTTTTPTSSATTPTSTPSTSPVPSNNGNNGNNGNGNGNGNNGNNSNNGNGNGNNGNGNGNSGSTGTSCSSGQQAIEITNNSGEELVMLPGAPWITGECSNLAVGATCTVCQERGSTGGNLQIGYGKANARSTWIEGNWDIGAEFPCMDISYIPGYTVPIVCTGSDGSTTIGMSEPLCADESCSNCNSGGGEYVDGSCQNPMGHPDTVLVDGPAPDFFKPATGIVYTFPTDDQVGFEHVWNTAKCVAHPQFRGQSSKREVEAPKAEEKRDEAAAHAHNHIGKRQRRHLHRHAVNAGSKF